MFAPVTDLDPRTHLPLRPAVFHILLALAAGDRHGYAVKQEVEELTDGVVRLGPGTLYEWIKKLRDQGWIDEADEVPEEEPSHAQRRYWRLLPPGRAVLEAETRRLTRLARHAGRRLGLGALESESVGGDG